MQRWYGCGKALWAKRQGSSPGTAPQLWQLDWGCLDTEWTYLDFPIPSHLLFLSQPQVSEETPPRALWGPRNKPFLSTEGSEAMVSGPQERSRGKVWADACSPLGPEARARQGAGMVSGFSWLLSDLGQSIGWHQTPLLATADADEAVSILAPAHAHTDLSGRDSELRLALSAARGPSPADGSQGAHPRDDGPSIGCSCPSWGDGSRPHEGTGHCSKTRTLADTEQHFRADL